VALGVVPDGARVYSVRARVLLSPRNARGVRFCYHLGEPVTAPATLKTSRDVPVFVRPWCPAQGVPVATCDLRRSPYLWREFHRVEWRFPRSPPAMTHVCCDEGDSTVGRLVRAFGPAASAVVWFQRR